MDNATRCRSDLPHRLARRRHAYWKWCVQLQGTNGDMVTCCQSHQGFRSQAEGRLGLMAVVGEIGLEPVDEFQPPAYVAKEAGTRYAITHGGVTDYALVSEGTDFGIVGVEAGKAFFKITVFGNDLTIYTPYIQRPTALEKSPSAIIRMSKLIARLDAWAYEYEQKNRYECAGGTVVPRSISAQSVVACLTRSPRPCSSAQFISMYASRQSKSRSMFVTSYVN